MFEIEDEALSVLDADPELDARLPSRGGSAACRAGATNRRAGRYGRLNAMHTTLWMIQEAYYHVH